MRNWPIVKTQLELFWSRNKKRSFIIFLVLLIITGTYYLYQQGILGLEQSGPTNPKSPTVPTNLIATAISSSQIDLSWGASTDDVGVAGYKVYRKVYRKEVYLSSITTTSISDTGLKHLTQYCYRVSAYDTAENGSAQSTQACATTLSPVKATPKHKESLKEIIIKHIKRGEAFSAVSEYDKAINEFNIVLKYDPNNEKASKGKKEAEAKK